ncbi:EAL domain, c-di-GMP-specific phosphodiesterase class I (or its enzymatically inactive variant) [Devosia lucknowensis]|uniref:EAL domain, c-di-GMP-specific phosphodiesterase class I (Or its enzymatically inactive variant) n=1 Tax=Devosia lucknowensis TaxID=1096929 RepID=A0A1Y6EV76_9HYPH|nr:EAL domain-containing protein [Devosia lucknowensis]SMQ66618.1 EAL domain, c-di-GMP-specific phosphodiesterase class I (or its enzymatically inactive variant) [Devosia lucknowensis]
MATSCQGCRDGEDFPVPFTMAFHPIVDVAAGEIWGYEALVRGVDGAGAHTILSAVTEANRYIFDQACRVKAIELAGAHLPASSTARLSINFMPNAVYEPRACIRATLAAAAKTQFNPRRLMFEFTENERMSDVSHVANIVAEYKRMGFLTALDDFGAGYAGLGLLAKFQTDLIKIDMDILRGIDTSVARQAVVAGIVGIARQLGIMVLAEGIETEAELMTLKAAGITLFQGYYFAMPQLEGFAARDDLKLAA